MPGSPREMVIAAERRFPVRIRIGVPPGGFGPRYAQITAWLDENCGSDRWAMTPTGTRGVLNDAVSLHLPMRCSPGRLSHDGAPVARSTRQAASSRSAQMTRRSGSRRRRTGRRDGSKFLDRSAIDADQKKMLMFFAVSTF
jgi:hypothetical protein